MEHRLKGFRDVTLRTAFIPEKPGALKNGRKLYSEALHYICSPTDFISMMKLADWTKAQSVFVEKGKFHSWGRRRTLKLPSSLETTQ